MSDPRKTWNRYARTILRAPGSVEAERLYREREDRNPERTVIDPDEEGALEHLSRYLFAAAGAAGRRVLDGGCGHGYGALLLSRLGAKSVFGIDRSAETPRAAFELSRRTQPDRAGKLSYGAGDLERLPVRDGSIDLVVALEVIEHLDRPERFLAEAARVLAPGGAAVLSTPNRTLTSPGWTLPPNRFHLHEYTAEELRSLVTPYFERVELLGQVPGPVLIAERKRGRRGFALAIAFEEAVGVDPRRMIPRPLRALIRGMLRDRFDATLGVHGATEATVAPPLFSRLMERIEAWLTRGLREQDPGLGGRYVWGRAEDSEQLAAICHRDAGSISWLASPARTVKPAAGVAPSAIESGGA